MRSKRKTFPAPIELPPYFPASRYEGTGDVVVDSESQKITSLPSLLDRTSLQKNQSKHISIRSVEDELLTDAERALIGDETPASDGLHPGIKYGGPAGGVLAPVSYYFYKMYRRWKTKKQRKPKSAKNTEDDESEEDDNSRSQETIITMVGHQISNAATSVATHIKGKIVSTGSSVVDQLKARAEAQEDEILESIKATVLEKEEAMVVEIKEKITNTQKTLTEDLKSKFSIFKKSSKSPDTNQLTFEEKKNEEEALCDVSDGEEDLVNTVKRRISDALIPEIEKSIVTTNESIIKNIETDVPQAKGHTWCTLKNKMKENSKSLFNDIKSILTCTEDQIVEGIKSHIDETKPDQLSQKLSQTNEKNLDETRVEIVNPNSSHCQTEEITEKSVSNDSVLLQEIKVECINPKQSFAKKGDDLENEVTECAVTLHEVKIETQQAIDNIEEVEKATEAIPKASDKEEHKEENMTNISQNDSIVDIKPGSNETQIEIKLSQELGHKRMEQTQNESTDSEMKTEKEVISENVLVPPENTLSKIKHKISEIPSHFLKHFPKIPDNKTQQETETSEESKTPLSDGTVPRTPPIAIPCIHQAKLNHFLVEKKNSSEEESSNETDKASSSEKENDNSFLDKMKHSVSHLPFNLNFSGIPDKVRSFIEPKKNEVELEEIKIESGIKDLPISTCTEDTHEGSVENSTRTCTALDHHNTVNIKEANKPDECNVTTTKWLELEEVETSWPSHLPKNQNGLSGAVTEQNENFKKRSRKHRRMVTKDDRNEDSGSQEEEEIILTRSQKMLSLKPDNCDEERKESIVSAISEFSTTSSVGTTSSGTLESRDSLPGPNLPNFDHKLKKKQNRSNRLKSLDSGIHHYYGEYIAIEFSHSEDKENDCKIWVEKGQDGKELIDEKSQDDKKTVIKNGDGVDKMGSSKSSQEPIGDVGGGGGGGYYEGCVVSLRDKRIEEGASK